jgi:hypothetical protein
MTIEYIFESFRALETVAEKVAYLQELETLALPYEINYEALIRAWSVTE